jgi:putative transposase
VSERVAYARELVAAGHRPAVVARILQISRQAIYRVPRPRRAPAAPTRPPTDEVEAAIVAEAEANPTDGYRMVTAWVRRRLGRRVNRKRVLRVMRERRLIQRRRPLDRRRRPGFFRVERPDQPWHLDLTSVWVAEHGWVYLMAAIDCCTREIVAWHLELRCRAREAIALTERAAIERGIAPGTLTPGHRQRVGVHRTRVQGRPGRPRDRAPPRRLPRPREPGVHRVLVRQAQGTLHLARRVRDSRPSKGGDRQLRDPLPPPAALAA